MEQEYKDILVKYVGKKIANIELSKDRWQRGELIITFIDGSKLSIQDQLQQCCEYRYMTTDDKLSDFVGSTFVGVEVRGIGEFDYESKAKPKEEKNKYNWDNAHEVAFMIVITTMGVFTCETHNEHNGYYGGFNIVITEEEKVDNDDNKQ